MFKAYPLLIFSLLAVLIVPVGCSHSSLTSSSLSSSAITFSPPGGPIAGQTSITITGGVFTAKLSITVGGVACPITTFTSYNVTCTVPAVTQGQWAPVVLTVPGQGTTTLAQTYAYGANVIGQSSFFSALQNFTYSMTQPTSAVMNGTNLYVADSQAARVLIYSTVPTSTGTSPSSLLGQNDLYHTPLAVTESAGYAFTMGRPNSLCTVGSVLMVVDTERSRILVYNSLPTGPTSAPSYVLGQTSFAGMSPNQGSSSLDGTMLNHPTGIYCSGSNAYVADTGNNRVLIWTTSITSNAQVANLVLGQASFNTALANQGGTAAAGTMSAPTAVYSDTTSLFVSDAGNNRVLVWSTIPAAQDAAADFALGQSDLVSSTASCSSSGLSSPSGLVEVGTYLYVADSGNHRITAYSTSGGIASTWTSGFDATFSVGQSSLTTCTANASGSVSASTLRSPTGLSSNATNLLVADTGNNRVLLFSSAPVVQAGAADIVLGQSSSAGSNPAASLMSGTELQAPQSALIANGDLYVSDPNLNRVLVYNPQPTATGATANYALGQSSLTSGVANSVNAGVSASTLAGPAGLFMDSSDNLYVADKSNKRLLVYGSPFTSNGTAASLVVGQSAFTTNSSGSTASTLGSVESACQGGTQLFVADTSNHRVLVYNGWTGAGSNGPSADYVLGQSSLTANSSNAGGSVAATSLYSPSFVACTSTQLFVSDSGNQRVLIFTLPIAANQTAASVVLGQADFASNSANRGTTVSLSTLSTPSGLAVDGSALYVADSQNNRILVWRTIPTTSGQAADSYYGQSSVSEAFPNAGVSTPTLTTVSNPKGLSVSDGLLVIADRNNARVLIIPEP